MPTPYGGRGREFHTNFLAYMRKIVEHPNYRGMPWAIDNEGKIRWNAPSYRPPGGTWSNLHDERHAWWRTKAQELGIPQDKGWISRVAKTTHPFKQKPCQICGIERSILYEYPTQRTVSRVNKIHGLTTPLKHSGFVSIRDIVPAVAQQAGTKAFHEICRSLKIPEEYQSSVESAQKYVEQVLIPSEPKGLLSPGSMSDAPDRLDGFHTYNICCRPSQDKGRTSENLRTYGTDRRAFQFWCEGDWAAADLVMNQKVFGQCSFCGIKTDLTADHVGPISLGFCHRPKFRALCRSCNSGRNNRMDYSDVRTLTEDENSGQQVVSWHAKAIWNAGKVGVRNNQDALELSKKMRVSQHHFLILLGKIKQRGHINFLSTLLHPEYSLNRYSLVGFNSSNFSFDRLVISRRATSYAKSKMERLVRIALDSLDDYASKKNRNTPLLSDSGVKETERRLLRSLAANAKAEETRRIFDSYMSQVADRLLTKGIPRAYELD